MAFKKAYLAGGCFWGLEELFRSESGVVTTEVGYTGGDNENPTYEHHPGHAEMVKITFDDEKTTYRALLDFFFRTHDPTTKNRQGNDTGSSYRSAIFYENDEQLSDAKAMIATTDASGLYKDSVVTTLEPLGRYYKAEDYHQNYLQEHPGGYTCHFVRTNTPLLASP